MTVFVASVPVIIGFLIGVLTGAVRAVIAWIAAAIFLGLLVLLFVRWGSLFWGVGLVATMAYPVIVIVAAFFGLIARYVYEEITA